MNESILNHLFLPYHLPSSANDDFLLGNNHQNEFLLLECMNEFLRMTQLSDDENSIPPKNVESKNAEGKNVEVKNVESQKYRRLKTSTVNNVERKNIESINVENKNIEIYKCRILQVSTVYNVGMSKR